MRSLRLLPVLLAFFGLVSTASAFDIVLNVTDGVGEGFNDNSAPFAAQTGNTGTTLGEQRLEVFQAAADYWEQHLFLTVDVAVDISFDPLDCQANSAVLGSAGATTLFRDFDNAPRADTLYVSAVANNLAGRRLGSNSSDISARFNSSIDNNNNCLNGTNWWLGIGSSAPAGTIGLYDTVLHEIGHGLGVSSGVRQDGELLAGSIDAYALYLYDESLGMYWPDMTISQRITSATNSGNVTFRGPNAESKSDHITSGKTNGHMRVFAPNPYQTGSSVSHWDTALIPDELMEPSATPTSDDRSTVQMLKDLGWQLKADQPNALAGSIAFSSALISVTEGDGSVLVSLSRTGGTDGDVSVLVDSTDGTAFAGSDYSPLENQLVSWSDGETGTKTALLTIVDDAFLESDETLSLALSNVSGGAALGTASAIVTINNDDVMAAPVPGTIGLVAATLSADEDQGVVAIELERSSGSDGMVSVLLNTANSSALAGSDYTAISNQEVSWADGESGVKSINLSLLDDDDVEENESLVVSIGTATGGASLGNSSTVITIVSEDVAPMPEPGFVGFVSSGLSVDEDQGIVAIQIQRFSGSDGAVTVTLNSSDDSAIAGMDYMAITNQMVSWADGESGVRSLNLRLIDDDAAEPDETFTLTLSGITGGASLSGSVTTVTIDSEDVSPVPVPGTIGFVSAAQSVNEDQNSPSIQLQRTLGFDGPVTVTLNTVDGTASAGVDYSPISNQVVSWADGDQSIKTVDLSLVNDEEVELDETFTATLSNVTGGGALGQSSSLITIVNDDLDPGSIGFVVTQKAVSESTASVSLEVSRVGGSDGAVSVRVRSFDVTASASDDYDGPINVVLNWSDGESGVKTVSVIIFEDEIEEEGELVDFTLSDVVGGASLTSDSFSLTIEDSAPSNSDDEIILNTIIPIIAASARRAKEKAAREEEAD